MFDQTAYIVKEGKTVDVMVTLCGNITGDVMVSVTIRDGTAGIYSSTFLYLDIYEFYRGICPPL